MAAATVHAPTTPEEAASLLAGGAPVRIRGGGTKLGWGAPVDAALATLSTARLDAIAEHNTGDLTAVLGAGVRLADAQAAFAAAGQMLALDPPLGDDAAATVGGIVATGDSGPLRHAYGAPRDLVLGVRVALADGTVARSGGKVIKNVAGYDLGKLLAGSFGTLGVVCEVAVRLHPRPVTTATAYGTSDDPAALAAAARELAHRPLEALALDVLWADGRGEVCVRLGGRTAAGRARAVAASMGLDAAVDDDDEARWERHRAAQRGALVVRVSTTQRGLARVLDAARALGAGVVARAGVGVAWVSLSAGGDDDAVAAVGELRARLRDTAAACVVLDAPAAVRAELDPWDEDDAARLALMRRVKARFDPYGTCNPGLFAGGI